ncbi:DGF-1-like protein, putative, partial [Bodo saltans]
RGLTNNRATTVSGNRPSCACTCSAGWAGADCSLRVCAIGPDCNTTGTKAAGGTYPKCVCTCKLHFGGLTCARPLTASVSPSNDVTSSKSISHDATPSDSATSTNELSSAHTASSSPPTHTKSTSPTISRTPTMTHTATPSPSQTNASTKTSSQISRNTSRTFSLTASKSLFGESWTGSNWSESLSIPFSSETSASATATGGFFSLSSTMLRSATLAHARSSTTSITESCAFPQLPPRLAPAAELVGGCTAHLPPTWTARVSSCIVGSSRIESDSSAVTFSRTALSYPYLLILPMVQQRQWRYSCPRPTAAESEEDVTCSVTQDDEKMVLLTLLMTTPVASVILECGTLSINVSWTVVWAEPMSAAVEVAAAIAAGGALLSGSGSAAAAMALVSLMSCSGKAPALASLGYVVSVFFELGFSGMAVGNIGLIVGLHLVHFSCVAAWKFVRRSPSLALASSDMRFPALSLLIACWLLPGSVYGAVAAITGNDDAAIGAVVLGLVCISIGISQFLLHHEVLPHASYVPHDRSLLSKGTRFPVLWWLIPESQWSPPTVVRRYHPLLTSRCRAHCWTAVMDTLLTCLLSVVAALGVGGNVSSCRAALIVVALPFFRVRRCTCGASCPSIPDGSFGVPVHSVGLRCLVCPQAV